MPTPAKPLQFGPGGTDTLLLSGQGVLMGYSVAETAAIPAAAALIVRDGQTTAGLVIARITLAASGSVQQWFGGLGIQFLDGLMVDIVTGEAGGALYVIPKELAATDVGHLAYPTGPQTLGYPYGTERHAG